jgi:hypothetical protein
LLGPTARQADIDLVARQVPDQGSADRRACRDRIGLARLVVANQPMLASDPRGKIFDLDSSAHGRGLATGGPLFNNCRGIQQSPEARKPRREDGLLLEGLEVVIVAFDLAESAGLIEAVRELDFKLMPQALDTRPQRPRTFAGDGRWRRGLGLDL